MIGTAPLSPRALRTRWALAKLCAAARWAEAGDPETQERVEAMGLAFPGRVGLAAGFDRHGALCGVAHRLGLGAIEIGTFTAPTGRVCGAAGLRSTPRMRAVVGVSIGKRPTTRWSQAEDAFLHGFLAHRRRGDYCVLNPGRVPPPAAHFAQIVGTVVRARDRVTHGARPLPVVATLASAWLDERQAVFVGAALVAAGAAGLLIPAEGFHRQQARQTLRDIRSALGEDVCLISVGGIASAREARARVEAGADIVQVHRALAAQGPGLIPRLNQALAL